MNDSPIGFVDDRRKAMRLSTNGKLVLASTVARSLLDKFPEYMTGDDTENMNSEERPLYTLCGNDNDNLSYAHTWILCRQKPNGYSIGSSRMR